MHRAAATARACLAAFVAVITAAVPALAQEREPAYSTWSKVENAPEQRAYKESLRDGGSFDRVARDFLVDIGLPQLQLPGNLPTIERVRRRIRELLLSERDIADAKALDEANRVAAEFMTRLAGSADAKPVVRINAMLLIGELRGKDGRPWPAAADTLSAACADASLPMAVRIAAAAGLDRHAEAAAGGSAAAFSSKAAPAIVAMTAPPKPGDDRVASDWLACRGLAMISALGPAAQAAVASATAILHDASRATDVRVRAAAALGAAATAGSGVEVAKALETIRQLAIAALRADLAEATRLSLDETIGSDARKADGTAAVIPAMACRRNAWRLVTLADALERSGGAAGLVGLPGADADAAKALAASLREAAGKLDADPTAKTVGDVLQSLDKTLQAGSPARGTPGSTPGPRPERNGDAPAEEPAVPNPFGN